MANLPLITVVADVIGNLINGHYRHQQQMTQLENEYRLEKARIEQDTTLSCKKIDALLSYALKDLEVKVEHHRQHFSLLVNSLNLQLEESRVLQQHINDLMKVAINPQEVPEIHIMVLKILDTMLEAQRQNSTQRHNLLVQHLQNSMLIDSNLGGFLPKL